MDKARDTDGGFAVPVQDRYFEDYQPGISCVCGNTLVTEEEILRFAREFDPQTMHVDPAAAETGPFHGLIASGWHTAAMVMRITVEHFLNSAASLASPGVNDLRWLKPVRPGDTLRVRFTILDSRPSQSKPDRGLVRTNTEVLNQSDEVVMSMTALNMIRRRGAAPGTTE
ncbi:MaoC family dehydratase [Parafrigoribacterium mesophilum]|uniref:MaoC family dehydratase n=1 Tax=Parafrigoribacterium mesophilum TaxID=433646 RepID=UPI0031FC7DC5